MFILFIFFKRIETFLECINHRICFSEIFSRKMYLANFKPAMKNVNTRMAKSIRSRNGLVFQTLWKCEHDFLLVFIKL